MKTFLLCCLFCNFSLAFAGPFVSGGDPTATPIVNGLVDGHEVKNKIKGYKVIIKLVDTSLADAPAEVLLKVTYENIKSFPLLFSLSGIQDFSPYSNYQVEVLIDSDGNGKISKGDYINTSAIGFKPFDPNSFAYVLVKEVK